MTTSCTLRANPLPAIAVFLLSALLIRAATPAAFDIPELPAPAALKLFIKQSGTQVVYIQDDLKSVTTRAVKGEFTPAEALAHILAGTGFTIETISSGNFTLTRQATTKPGSIVGVVRNNETGKPVVGAKVAIVGTDAFVVTDDRGHFVFAEAPTGDQELEITADGIQNTKVTDATVKAGRKLTLNTINVPAKPAGVVHLDTYVVSAKKNDGVLELDPYSVESRREKPFVAGNMDIPRTINDAQPYYVFNAKTLDSSGAVNVEDFLKQRLTMNTTIQTNTEDPLNSLGNTSSINLRGVGTDKTLILVNGRRMAGVTHLTNNYQPDLNGIPMSAIERIEVLPSSASGIYGGSAIGGVVNVILKQNYSGGEIRASYDNDWHSDAPKRTVSLSYGMSLEGGKTNVNVSASWQDSKALLLQDRVDIFQANLNDIQSRSPGFVYSSTSPWLGSLPNITSPSLSATTLVLKSGNVALGSRNTFIPAGTSASTSASALNTALLANAGKWNLDFPLSTQSPTGLLRPLTAAPQTRSLRASVRRKMLPGVEAFADFSYNDNRSNSIYHPVTSYLTVPAAAPTNPFTTDVRVMTPDDSSIPLTTRSQSRSATVGAQVELPWNWTAALDYTWSESRFQSVQYIVDTTARTADLRSGALNPFVDTLLYPLDFRKYLISANYNGSNRLHDVALRGSGALPNLPWGQPMLTLGLEHRLAQTPERSYRYELPITVANSYVAKYYERESTTNSGYLEMTVPVMKKGWLAGAHALDLQFSGRSEHYTVDTGTPLQTTYFNRTPVQVNYSTPTLNGQPYFSEASYSSSNYTAGLKYQPVPEVTVRISRATAFLPPTPSQLIKDPLPSTTTTSVLDPVTGRQTSVYTLGGGNPNLKPQSSKSFNAGVIWEPKWKPLAGLRLNAEYYRIEQFDYIDTLGAQGIVNLESIYPGRVVRDSTGTITQVDNSMVNLYSRDTEGWDLSASYTFPTSIGRFSIYAVESIILHVKNQYSLNLPEVDAVEFPGDGGAAKYKSNVTLNWEWRGWTAGWTTRYFGSYKQFGVAGGPYSLQSNGGAAYTYYTLADGRDRIPSQTYHDLYLGHSFGNRLRETGSDSRLKTVGKKLLDGLSIQVNVRNVFDKSAPLDTRYTPYYLSPYGGGLAGLRSYVLTVKKAF